MSEGVKAVLIELDGIARDVCHYEYGLPLFTDGAMERMSEVVSGAIRAAVLSERQRVTAIVTACNPDTVYAQGSDGEEYAGGVSMEQAREWILARVNGGEGNGTT